MFLDKLLSRGRKEKKVVSGITRHLRVLCTACETFRIAFEQGDRDMMRKVVDLESEGDSIRREIIADIYSGAFLPLIRPDLCRFIEAVDRIFDPLQDAAFYCLDLSIPESIKDECIRISSLNSKMCEMLPITFEAMLKGENLEEKNLAVRIYEKKIDDIKFGFMSDISKVPVTDFWQGKFLSNFIDVLTAISDLIEDASDYLQIISVVMR